MSVGARPRRSAGQLLQKAQHVHSSCLSRLQRSFRWLGLLVGGHAVLFLLISLLFSTVSYGAFSLRVAQRLQDGFISSHSKARVEEAIRVQFEGEENRNVQRFVALVRKTGGGNLLDREVLRDVNKVYDYIKKNISVEIDGKEYKHSEICENLCEVNQLLWAFQRCVEGVYDEEDVFVDHPQSRFQQYNFLMAPHVFGITRRETEMANSNGTAIFIPYNSNLTWPAHSNRTAISSASMIALYFQAPIPDDNRTNIITEWEEAIFRWSLSPARPFSHLRIDVMGDKVLGREMTKSGLSLLPHLISGISLTIAFVTAMVLYNASTTGRKDFGLVVIVIGIIASPLLAVSSTFGIMGIFGIEAYPMHMVIPFLILAIGVDDAFLMTHSWDRLRPRVAPFRTKNTADLLAQVLEEVGPSITITSLTNALAFAIGLAVSAPAMHSFCLAAAVAIVMDFFFEITLFGSLLVVSARFQKATADVFDPQKRSGPSLASRYSKELTRTRTRSAVLIGTAIFFLTSLYGTITMETQVDSQKIIPNNSSLKHADHLFKEFYWKEYEAIFIYVNRPPAQLAADSMKEMRTMIGEFEGMPRAIGNKSTMLWLNDYERAMEPLYSFYSALGGDFALDYEELPTFLADPRIGTFWNKTVKWHRDENNRVVVDQFYFVTGIHNATTWMQRAENMLTWREIADKWSRFNVTVYSENSGVFEGIFNLAGQTTLAAVLTLVSMVVVCLLFVPSLMGVIFAALAIASISIGVLGFLSLSSMDLDPVTMSAIVMSIGFSVDYTAHVSFHFQHSFSVLPSSASSADCVQYTIEAVAWPMAEAAASTLVCFLPVAFHSDYTPTVFVKTIFFVVVFGVLHGLLVLPTVLSMIPRRYFVFEAKTPLPVNRTLLVPPTPGEEKLQPPATLPSEPSSSNLSGDTTVSLLTGS